MELGFFVNFKLYLASASPRRRELLSQIGVTFETLRVRVDESLRSGESPQTYVTRLALAKARAGWQQSALALKLPVLGADTTVVCDGRIMGKPLDRTDGLAMLRHLSGKAHQVWSAVAIVQAGREDSRTVVTEVYFRVLAEGEAEAYWQTGEPCDKAGAYGIQGYASIFVARIEGSYSNVVGLPLMETAQLLAEFDVPIWN